MMVSCVRGRLEKRLDSSYQEVVEIQEKAQTSSKTPASLTWNTASKLLLEKNTIYQRSSHQLEELEEERKWFYWRQLNPRLSAVSNLSTALGEISNLRENNVGIRLLGNISIPQPFTLYASRYTLELRYYQAKLDHELLNRRLHSNLYAAFLNQEQLNIDRSSVKKEDAPLTLQELITKAKSRSQSEISENLLLTRQQRIQSSLERLLNNLEQEMTPLPHTLPNISYRKKLDHLNTSKGYGSLALKQAAGQLEASLATLWQLKFQRLQSFNTGVSLPTLYDSQTNAEPDFSQIRLFGSLNETFDLTGADARRARVTERRVELLRNQITTRLYTENENLTLAKEKYQGLLVAEKEINKRLRLIKKIPPKGDSQNISEYLSEIESLRQQDLKTKQNLRRLDLEFWIWDEDYWTSPF